MKNKNLLLGLSIILFFLLKSTVIFGQTYPINITTFVKPPYPTKFEDWESITDKIFINLTNISSSNYDVNLNLAITGPNGFTVNKQKVLDYEFNLGSHKTISIKGNDWDNYGMNLKIDDIFPESERLFVVKNRAFREGNYNICWQAVDKNGINPLSDKTQGCYSFEVTYGESPKIINPTANLAVPAQSPSLVSINWTHQTTGAPFEYTVKVIELTKSIPKDINLAMNNPGIPAFFEEDAIKGFSKILRNENFKKGNKYAVRVTARDPKSKVYFKNAGHSEIIIFTYGQETGPCSNMNLFSMKPHFPVNGDTLPFIEMPLVAEMSPQCDNYNKLDFEIAIKGKKQSKKTVIWNDGALKYLKKQIGDDKINWQMASKMQLYQGTFTRGEKYNWSSVNNTKNRKGQTFSSTIDTISFVVGMPKPKLSSPYKDEKVAAGNITFSWKPIMRQKKMLPDYQLVNFGLIKSKKHSKTKIAKINEHWVIQVFSQDKVDNSKIVGFKDGKIEVDPDDFFNSSSHTYNATNMINRLGADITADIKIDKQGDYWWRVVWLKNPSTGAKSPSESSIYHASSLQKFHVGPKDNDDTEPDGDCISKSIAKIPTDKTATKGLKKDQILKIGLFDLKVTEVTSSKNNIFSGKGEIVINFMNKLKMEVVFKDIKKNKANQIFEGTVKAVKNTQYSKFFSKYGSYIGYAKQGAKEGLGQLKNVFKKSSDELANELEGIAKSTDRLIRSLRGKKTGLPVGLDKTFDGYTFVITIADMTFTPRNAVMNTLIDIKIPGLDFDISKYLILDTEDISFSPSGLGTEGKAFLAFDANFVLNKENGADANELIIKGKSDKANDFENSTYVQWNCHGFKELNIALEYKFSRKIIIPDDENNKGRVVARTRIKTKKGLNIMGKITMDAFQLPFEKMKGYGFNVTDAYIDLSDLSNPTGLIANLPKNYNNQTLKSKDSRLGNKWRGFWLKKMEVKIPKYIGNVDEGNRNTKVSVENMIIDKTGFTASFRVKDLIKWEQKRTKNTKHVDGCAFSLDLLYVNVLQNKLESGGLEGKIGLPIAEERDYLSYKGVIDKSTDKSIKFTVKPKKGKNITVPIFFARMTIGENSTIGFSLGNKNYVSFKLDVMADFNTDYLSNENKKLLAKAKKYGLKMPQVKMEGFEFHSSTGFKTKNFSYALASPPKFLAGFPLSLKNINLEGGITSPKLSFTLALSFMSKGDKKKSSGNKSKNSISAETTLAIKASKIDIKKLKSFKIEKVSLKKIAIKAEFSKVKLDGFVQFKDEDKTDANGKRYHLNGFAGKIDLTLPGNIGGVLDGEFGTVKYSTAKKENTAQWYSYWRVFGKANLGSGIPVFSGVNLVMLKGGVSYHMLRTNNETYSPDFNTLIGLQFGAGFQSSDGGKAFKINADIYASFIKGGGLRELSISGEATFMNKDKNSKTSAVSAYLKLSYKNNQDQGGIQSFDGNLIVDINVKNKLYGYAKLSTINNTKGANKLTNFKIPENFNHPFVWAVFHSEWDTKNNKKVNGKKKTVSPEENDKGNWYFYMGTPESRGALKLDLSKKGKKESAFVINLTSYLMIGKNIPTTLPEPSQEFKTIYDEASVGKGQRFKGGDVSKLIAGQKKKNPAPGKGFAFGSTMSLDLNARPVPFYFDLHAAIGFDINYTKSDMKCDDGKGSTFARGNDGWYASGQLYAGLRAAFGIHVKLWFIDKDIELLKAAAAMILEGGFPNPNYANGEGALSYRILNGLIEGNYHFTFETGQKCQTKFDGASYLNTIKFVQDMKPDKGSKKVDVFSECSVAFAVPVEKIMVIPVDSVKVIRLQPYVHSWTLTKKKGNKVKCDGPYFNSKYTAATLSPEQMLNEYTAYNQKIEIRALELYSTGNKVVRDSTGKIWSEIKEYSFKTGKAPDVFVEKNINFTYPLKNQRSFLKGETDNRLGYMVVNTGRADLFKNTNNRYFVRFTKIDGSGTSTETPLITTNSYKEFSYFVGNLDNDQYYCMQIIEQKPKQVNIGEIDSNMHVYDSQMDNLSLHEIATNEKDVKFLEGSKSTMKSKTAKIRELPGTQVKDSYERILYHYYFKTSKYNTFKEKITQGNWSAKFSSTVNAKNFFVKYTSDEPLEEYDLNGYGHQDIEPLVNLDIKFNSNKYPGYHMNLFMKRNFIDGHDRLMGIQTAANYYIDRLLSEYKLSSEVKPEVSINSDFIKFYSYTDLAKPISKKELNQFNKEMENNNNDDYIKLNNDNPFSGIFFGSGNYPSNSFSGAGTLTADNIKSSYNTAISYRPQYGGYKYLNRIKQSVAKDLDKIVYFPKNSELEDYYLNKTKKPEKWWKYYFKAPIKTSNGQTYYLTGTADYERVYYKYMIDSENELSGLKLKNVKGFNANVPYARLILNMPKSVMDYPNSNSFIMAYKYPNRRLIRTINKKIQYTSGTNYKIKFNK